jgi:hypothetical protein
VADEVIAITQIHGVAGRREEYQRALFAMLARPSDMRLYRAPRSVRPEPSGPPDPRSVD